ncbi:MAG: 1,4-alpha-glucan branching protein GlgB [Bacteroidota bacterium]
MKDTINHSLLTDFDTQLFGGGKHFRIYEKLGSHLTEMDGQKGVYFAVWAPNARKVSVIGSFNDWNNKANPLAARWDSSGIWEGFIPDVEKGALYKYNIQTQSGYHMAKSDPYARFWEVPPNTASIVWDMEYEWNDSDWMKQRAEKAETMQPYSVYEVHLGSWKKKAGGAESLSYRELGKELVEYVAEMGFTHVEFMPVMEHPYYPSWGYQVTGYFAPSSRYGTPEEFAYLVDQFHQAGIGVILDWVPSHFPTDAFALSQYDGTHLYEHEDPRKGFHPDWKSAIFNYGRNEVRSFLISNALYWLEKYHIDGLRVDAVASMLYLDYSRNEGEWIPNEYGGRENMEAISFLKDFNQAVYKEYPDAVTIAEESTAWSGVSRPVYTGGLGFGQKWMMGWMHDTLEYFKRDTLYRKFHHNEITFSLVYAFSENFMLPLSHDEVVYGKKSIIGRMPGDEWQRAANLRVLYGYMFTHPGTNLLFMGGEFGQTTEWSHEKGLDWQVLEHKTHQDIQNWVKDLNKHYKDSPALYEKQFDPEGFEWIEIGDAQNSILSYVRKGKEDSKMQLIICNFTPSPREKYRVGVLEGGEWRLVLNSDEKQYGGSGLFKTKSVESSDEGWNFKPHSIYVDVPPLSVTVYEQV